MSQTPSFRVCSVTLPDDRDLVTILEPVQNNKYCLSSNDSESTLCVASKEVNTNSKGNQRLILWKGSKLRLWRNLLLERIICIYDPLINLWRVCTQQTCNSPAKSTLPESMAALRHTAAVHTLPRFASVTTVSVFFLGPSLSCHLICAYITYLSPMFRIRYNNLVPFLLLS